MNKLFKSKFLFGVMIVAAMFVFAGTVGTKTASADCSITMTLRVGSKGVQVQCLQTVVGATADGSFGPKTKVSVMAWQSGHGLVADGVFGPKSNAVLMALGSTGVYPAGCSSVAGYSSTTGLPCSGGSPWPAGCASGSGFSPTTGQPCAGMGSLPAGCATGAGFSSTTGAPCTVTTTNTGTNGYLTDLSLDSTGRVSTVYEGEQDRVVAGFRATARLSSQNVDRVRVTFVNANTVSSSNLSKYISGASLWLGSTKLATIAITDADRSTSTPDTYTFNFSGLHGMIPKDTIGRFYVSVNANGSLDSNDTVANWTVTFLAGGISSSSPDGSYDTYPANAIPQTGLMFGKFSTSGVKSELNLSATNPVSSSVAVNATAVTNNVTVLKFKVKATNSNLTLRQVPVQISLTSTTGGDNIVKTINSVRLMQGTNVVDSVDPSASRTFTAGAASNPAAAVCADDSPTSTLANDNCTFFFSNLSSPYNTIASGSEVEYSIVIDFKSQANYAAGTTITASVVNADVLLALNYSVQDTNGDQLTNNNSSVRVGSAVGNIMTLLVNGVNVVQGAATYSTVVRGGTGAGSADVVDATYTIPLTVTSFGQTTYAGQVAIAASTVTGATGAAAQAVAYGFNLSSLPGTLTSYSAPDVNITVGSSTLSSSDAIIEGLGYRLDSGQAKHFTLTVNLNSIGATAGAAKSNVRVALQKFATWTNGALSLGQAIQTLLPIQSYQTGYVAITAN